MKKIGSYFWNILPPILILFATILVILFSKGWRLDIKEKTVISTGILDISSDPKGAELLLNGKKQGKTPVVIDSLPSGTYTAEIRKEKYVTWQKEIEIAGEKVLKIETNLFEEETDLNQVSDIPLERIYFSPKGEEALIASLRNGNQGVWKIQLNPSFFLLKKSLVKLTNLYEPGFFDLLTSNYNINISPNFTKAIISVTQTKEEIPDRIFLLNLQISESNLQEITEFIPTDTNIQWTQNGEFIFFTDNTALYSLDTESFRKTVISGWNYNTLWTISNEKVYFTHFNPIAKSYNLFSANFNGAKRETLIPEKLNVKDISLLITNLKYDTLIIGDDQATYAFDLRSGNRQNIINYQVSLINISPDQRYFLFKQKNGDKLVTFDFEYLKLYSPFSVETKNLRWTPNSLKIFYRYSKDDGSNILGSIDPDGSNEHEILNLKSYNGLLDREFGFSSDSKKVYLPLLSSYNYLNKQDSTEEEKLSETVLFEIELR